MITQLLNENRTLFYAAVEFLAECENTSNNDIWEKLSMSDQNTQQRIETLINFAKNLEK